MCNKGILIINCLYYESGWVLRNTLYVVAEKLVSTPWYLFQVIDFLIPTDPEIQVRMAMTFPEHDISIIREQGGANGAVGGSFVKLRTTGLWSSLTCVADSFHHLTGFAGRPGYTSGSETFSVVKLGARWQVVLCCLFISGRIASSQAIRSGLLLAQLWLLR